LQATVANHVQESLVILLFLPCTSTSFNWESSGFVKNIEKLFINLHCNFIFVIFVYSVWDMGKPPWIPLDQPTCEPHALSSVDEAADPG
jgi:hypothetical protein